MSVYGSECDPAFNSYEDCRLFIEDEWDRKRYIRYVPCEERIKLSIGFIPKLARPETLWDPFTVVVKKIRKKYKHYHVIIFDGKQVYSAIFASQFNQLIENGLLCPGRVINVLHYAVSTIDLDDGLKKIIIITDLSILLVQGSVNLIN